MASTSSGIQISFPGVDPRVAGRLVQEIQQDLAANPIEGVMAEPVKPDPNTLDLGTMLLVLGNFWADVSAHATGHVMGVAALSGLLAVISKRAARSGVTPTVTPVNAPPEAEKAIAELKTKHGVN